MSEREIEDNLRVLQSAATLYINRYAQQAKSRPSKFDFLMEIIEQRLDAESETEHDIASLADLGVIVVLTHLAITPQEDASDINGEERGT